jgi:hypothetical protein
MGCKGSRVQISALRPTKSFAYGLPSNSEKARGTLWGTPLQRVNGALSCELDGDDGRCADRFAAATTSFTVPSRSQKLGQETPTSFDPIAVMRVGHRSERRETLVQRAPRSFGVVSGGELVHDDLSGVPRNRRARLDSPHALNQATTSDRRHVTIRPVRSVGSGKSLAR